MVSNRRLAAVCLPLLLAACSEALEGPSPKLATVSPGLVCNDVLITPITVRGSGFSPLPVDTLGEAKLELPKVTLTRSVDLDGAAAGGSKVVPPEAPMEGPGHVRWVSQEELSFEVFPELALEPGLYGITLENRNGAASTLADSLVAIPPPVVSRIDPDLLCGEKGNTFRLQGQYFLRLADGTLPTVMLDSGDAFRSYQPTEMGGCKALPGSSGAQICTDAEITIPADELAPGQWNVVLSNPAPAGCMSSEPQTLTVVPEPTVTMIEPDLACLADGGVPVTLTGEGFLVVDGVAPTLAIGERTYETTATGCTDVEVMRESVQTCTELAAVVGQDDLEAGNYRISVTNPPPADCGSDDVVGWTVVDEPVIATVEPAAVCTDGTTDETLVVTGTGFLVVDGVNPVVRVDGRDFASLVNPGSCATVDGPREQTLQCTSLSFVVPAGTFLPGTYAVEIQNPAPAACVSSEPATVRFVGEPQVFAAVPNRICSGGGSIVVQGDGFEAGATVTLGGVPAESVVVNSATELVATWGDGQTIGGPYDLVVSNAPSCDATLSGVVTVITGPQLFFADPPVVYNGIGTQVILYATGVSDTVESVGIRPAGTTDTPVTLVHSWNAARPNRVQIVVPAGTAPGAYDVLLEDTTECQARLIGGLTVTGTLSVSVASIDPPFGWTDSDTAVTVRGEEPAPVGQVGFAPVPRLYLNPANPTVDSVATPLSSAALLGPTSATAVVPDGLAAETYDLIVVNPDGTVGLLEDAFRVTDLPPPTVSTISPGSIPNSSGQTVYVFGADFRTPEVTLLCKDPGTGAVTPLSTNETSTTSTQIVAQVDASQLAGGAICVVRVTNADQQTWADFSALVVTNPAQNLGVMADGPTLLETRRAPASVSVAATSASRFVFAIGGDDGTLAGARSTVESAAVDVYGSPSSFTAQRYGLVHARSFAGAVRIGRHVYVAGGADGVGPLAEVERAYVLDPADRVEITDLEIKVDAAVGLAPGVYSYRVAPLRPADDAKNPGGEELPSEPFPVILPVVEGRALQVQLTWSLSPGAVGYRVYRSPVANDPAGSEKLIGEIADGATTTFLDDGLVAGDLEPLPLGSTGAWSVVATLAEARQGAGVAVLEQPDTAGVHHLYVAGGLGAAPLRSIETIRITENADGSQTVDIPNTSAAQLGTARWDMGIYAVTHETSSRIVDGSPWIYVAGGATDAAANNLTGVTDAIAVNADGSLGAVTAVDSMSNRAGFGVAAANNFLHAFGGRTTATSVVSAEHCGAGRACTGGSIPDPPDLVNWNSAGNLGFATRMNMGSAIQSGFIYLLGGSDGTQALRSTQLTHW